MACRAKVEVSDKPQAARVGSQACRACQNEKTSEAPFLVSAWHERKEKESETERRKDGQTETETEPETDRGRHGDRLRARERHKQQVFAEMQKLYQKPLDLKGLSDAQGRHQVAAFKLGRSPAYKTWPAPVNDASTFVSFSLEFANDPKRPPARKKEPDALRAASHRAASDAKPSQDSSVPVLLARRRCMLART